MSKNNVEKCNLPKVSGQQPEAIKYVESSTMAPLTRPQIKESLVNFFNSPESVELNKLSPSEKGLFLFNFLFNKENRQKIKKSVIKKVKASSD